MPENKHLISSFGQELAYDEEQEFTGLATCTQEESDSRRFLHLQGLCHLFICKDCVIYRSQKLITRTLDTDVVVLAVATFEEGAEKSFHITAVLEVFRALGPSKVAAHPTFHGFHDF